ncbi:MAG: integration host factor subunit alpha [Rhizobiaceae bacterium]|nr:integration host factor subunit alpha [Rhizobiaceae bacterium]
MSLTRRALSEKISVQHGLPMREARDLVDLMFDEMARAIAAEETVKLANLGSFSVHQTPARLGRNPKTGEPAEISERKRLTFKPSKALLERVKDRT